MTQQEEPPPAVRVSDVFVPGRLPRYTYIERSAQDPQSGQHIDLSLAVTDYLEERGAILTVYGPTKTGKTVLLERVVPNPLYIESQGIESEGELWLRLGDRLGVCTTIEGSETDSTTVQLGSRAGASVWVASGEFSEESSDTEGGSSTRGFTRPVSTAVSDELDESRAIIVDDFHFIPRPVQRDIVRALKPLCTAGVPIILVSISHRFTDVISAEPDMTGRVRGLGVRFWNIGELLEIAREGFEALNVMDPDGELALRLAQESYGSPHLMQQFCRELVKLNGIRAREEGEPRQLKPPEDFAAFFRAQADPSSRTWFTRLQRGPKERGRSRAVWRLTDGRELDNYGLVLAALADLGAPQVIPKGDVVDRINGLVRGTPPAPHQTTRVLSHMSKISRKRATEWWPDEEELDEEEEDPMGLPDSQPVMEFVEEALHLADPFFAFSVKWSGDLWLAEDPAAAGGAAAGS